MTIEGVRRKSGDGYDIFYVDSLSEQFKEIIRADLSTICYGPRLSGSGTKLHTYEKTIKELHKRYSTKSEETQTGMIGELIAHVTIRHNLPELKSISILINPNEMSIKKGFDLNFLKSSELWYGEVKASRSIKTLDTDNKSLLTKAKASLVTNFGTEELRDSLWLGAINESAIMFNDDELQPISRLLDESHDEIAERAAKATNVILISVPFHETSKAEISEKEVIEYLTKLKEEGAFNDVALVCVQKSLFKAVEDFMAEEATAYA